MTDLGNILYPESIDPLGGEGSIMVRDEETKEPMLYAPGTRKEHLRCLVNHDILIGDQENGVFRCLHAGLMKTAFGCIPEGTFAMVLERVQPDDRGAFALHIAAASRLAEYNIREAAIRGDKPQPPRSLPTPIQPQKKSRPTTNTPGRIKTYSPTSRGLVKKGGPLHPEAGYYVVRWPKIAKHGIACTQSVYKRVQDYIGSEVVLVVVCRDPRTVESYVEHELRNRGIKPLEHKERFDPSYVDLMVSLATSFIAEKGLATQ